MNPPVTIISLTEAGALLGRRLQQLLAEDGGQPELLCNPKPFAATVQQRFQAGHRLLLVCASGIAMRTLAPVLQDKYNDPAVLLLDEQGRFVVPLLSGHEGGANHWGSEVAAKLGAELVITTARPYLNPHYVAGMGCERHCPETVLRGLLEQCLTQAGLELNQLSAISSIDIKADEVGLITLAQSLGLPYLTWRADQLHPVEDQLSTKSDYVFKTVGVYGVAESAALVSAGHITGSPAELMLPKQKNKQATCAIARSYGEEHSEKK
ncbi:cobalamin biosynthesis protein [Marinobacterium jannaschii]|uniref:cobalamin biosynthesis protein n=1 Tax=Marinobacterium jannaschii TaxID=64970 RepID=UPI000489CB5F|nr:cobalamin biosynthesis protein [Marinobacterium jannaschii]